MNAPTNIQIINGPGGQPAYAQQESSERLRKLSRDKIAAALGIKSEQLDF